MEIKTPEQWIIFGKVGTSSKTIWGVMTGAIREYIDSWDVGVPHDIGDFGRCCKLIHLFPEWRERLLDVSTIFPNWVPYIREWDKLEEVYMNWCFAEDRYNAMRGKHPRIAERQHLEAWRMGYGFIQDLKHEGMILDGWVQTGPGGWRKEKVKQTMPS